MAYHIRRVILDHRAKLVAQRRVKHAVKCGQLVNLKKKKVKCADCVERATVYDHRRYSEPLVVDPVCKHHNGLRGFALDQAFVDVMTGKPRTKEDYLAERAPKKPRLGEHVVSAITGRTGYLRNDAEKRDWYAARVRGRRQAAHERVISYLNTEYKYHLWIGGVDTGTEKLMTGREATFLNRQAEATFIRELEVNKSVRMHRWRLTERGPGYARTNRKTRGFWQPKCTYARFGKS